MSTLGAPLTRAEVNDIESAARRELAEEFRLEQVASAKARIKKWRARPWWKRWLPFTVSIRFHWNWSH